MSGVLEEGPTPGLVPGGSGGRRRMDERFSMAGDCRSGEGGVTENLIFTAGPYARSETLIYKCIIYNFKKILNKPTAISKHVYKTKYTYMQVEK